MRPQSLHVYHVTTVCCGSRSGIGSMFALSQCGHCVGTGMFKVGA
jgi:hypothetical protein